MEKSKFKKAKKKEDVYTHYAVTIQEKMSGDLYCSIYLYKSAKDDKPSALADVTIPEKIFGNNWSKKTVVECLKQQGHL